MPKCPFIALLLLVLLTACQGSPAPLTTLPVPPQELPTPPQPLVPVETGEGTSSVEPDASSRYVIAAPMPPPEHSPVEVVEHLRALGVAAQMVGPATHRRFATVGHRVRMINDSEVQVFTYPDAPSALAALAGVSATDLAAYEAGSHHLYYRGRLVLLYMGEDPVVLALLNQTLGAPVVEN